MSVATERVSREYNNVVANIAINVDIPCFDEEHVTVLYGRGAYVAERDVDYTVILSSTYSAFTVTPTTALLTKITAMIAADSNESNRLIVRRTVPLLTDITPDAVRFRDKVSNEFDLNTMRMQQLNEALRRSIKTADGDPDDMVLPSSVERPFRVGGYDGLGRPAVANTTLDQLDALTLEALASGAFPIIGTPIVSDGVQTGIPTGTTLISTAQVWLVIGGGFQAPGSGAYSVSGENIVLSEPAPEGVVIEWAVREMAQLEGVDWANVYDKPAVVEALSSSIPALQAAVVALDEGKADVVHGHAQSDITGLAAALALLAPLASPALTGTPTAPTADSSTNSTQIATTAFVQAVVAAANAALVGGAPEALDTLNELAAALGDDPNFATTMTNALAAKAPLASPAFTGVVSAASASEIRLPGTGTTGSSHFYPGNGDGASYTTHNVLWKLWWGLGLAGHDNVVSGYYDARTGTWDVKGGYKVNGTSIFASPTFTGNVTINGVDPTVQCIPVACSDETTALTTGTAKVTFRMPCAFTLTAVRASLTTAQTSGSIFTVDINEGGTSILSTKITIDNGEKTSTTAATAAVISDTALADDAEITIDIDQIGDGTAKGLKVYLIGRKA